jgi:phage shock protein A
VVRLERVLREAQEHHRQLRQRAVASIGDLGQAVRDLDQALTELDKVRSHAIRAVDLADEAARAGDLPRIAEQTSAAESFAARLVALERDLERHEAVALGASQAADDARAALRRHAAAQEEALAQATRLLSPGDRARMAEPVRAALASMAEPVGDEAPTGHDVRARVEARPPGPDRARAARSDPPSRLARVRAQLGVAPASPSSPDLAPGAAGSP